MPLLARGSNREKWPQNVDKFGYGVIFPFLSPFLCRFFFPFRAVSQLHFSDNFSLFGMSARFRSTTWPKRPRKKLSPVQLPKISHSLVAPVRFDSVTVCAWTVRAVPVFGSDGSSGEKVLTERRSFGFGSWKAVPAVPVPRAVPGKTVPTVPIFSSVLGPSCLGGGSGTSFKEVCFGRIPFGNFHTPKKDFWFPILGLLISLFAWRPTSGPTKSYLFSYVWRRSSALKEWVAGWSFKACWSTPTWVFPNLKEIQTMIFANRRPKLTLPNFCTGRT